MKLFKRAAAAAVCAVMLCGTGLSAFAEAEIINPGNTETSVIDPGNTETSVIDTGDTETSVIDTGNTETSIIDPESVNPDQGSGLDVSDELYQEIDLTGYTKWDGKTKMVSGTNYYIEDKVAPRINFAVPKNTRFVLKSGAQLVIYKGRLVNVRGTVTVEPGAELVVSGKLTVYDEAGLENYGTAKGSVSSEYRIAGDYINRAGGKTILSGAANVYKSGVFLNYGQATLTSNAKMKVTGDFQTSETGRLLCAGYIAVTINGRTTQAGYFSLTGEVVNSGVFIFERTVRYYKSKSARFAVSKSSRLIDYRYHDPDEERDDDDEPGEDATDIGIKGIDVSYCQGAINWDKVKDAGIEFVMMRASRGALGEEYPPAEDTTFRYNVTEATRVGIDVGVYHYMYAETVEEAREEAKFFIKTISPYKITYPVVLDVEEQSQADLGVKKITEIAKAFLDEVNAAGYYAMLYSNKAWLTYNLDAEALSEYDLWLAQWNTVPTYKGEFGIWQYSCKGVVSGIDTYVDLDIAYKNYAKIIKKGGYNHLS